MTDSTPRLVVVVADDEPAMLDVLVQHLKAVRSPRFEVTAAEDGEEAWGHIHELLPDLVVLDVMMPGMSGWEVCRKVRESPALAHTAVVILTGIGERTNEMTSPLFGADAHLDKPFEFDDLDARIVEALALRARQRSLPSAPGSAAKHVRPHRPSKAPAGARAGAKARPSASVPARAKRAKGKAPLSAGAKTTGSKVISSKVPRAAIEPAKPAKKAAAKPAKKAAAEPAKKAAAKPAKKAAAKPAKKAAAKPAKKAAAKPAKKAAAKPVKKAAAKPPKKR